MTDNENTQQEINVPALQARFAAITDMWQQAQGEIVELRAALKMRDASDEAARSAIQQLVQERDALEAQLEGTDSEDAETED